MKPILYIIPAFVVFLAACDYSTDNIDIYPPSSEYWLEFFTYDSNKVEYQLHDSFPANKSVYPILRCSSKFEFDSAAAFVFNPEMEIIHINKTSFVEPNSFLEFQAFRVSYESGVFDFRVELWQGGEYKLFNKSFHCFL